MGNDKGAVTPPPAGGLGGENQDKNAQADATECERNAGTFCNGVGMKVYASFFLVIAFAVALALLIPQFRQSGMLTLNNVTANTTIYMLNIPIKPLLITPLEGVSLFAVIYLFAQIVERIVEPFSDLKVFQSSHEIEQKSSEIDLREAKIKKMLEDKDKQYTDIKWQKSALDYVSKHKSKMDALRKVQLWAFSSILGVIICYSTIGLFELSGIPILHFWDALFSGMLIGGGTKSLHDLISSIEKKGK